jgi:hypothetical protein
MAYDNLLIAGLCCGSMTAIFAEIGAEASVSIHSRNIVPAVTFRARNLVLMDRIEHHASARRWCRRAAGVQENLELLG